MNIWSRAYSNGQDEAIKSMVSVTNLRQAPPEPVQESCRTRHDSLGYSTQSVRWWCSDSPRSRSLEDYTEHPDLIADPASSLAQQA